MAGRISLLGKVRDSYNLLYERLEAQMVEGGMLEKLAEIERANRTYSPPRTSKMFVFKAPATVVQLSGAGGVHREMPIRLIVQVVNPKIEAGMDLAEELAILAGEAAFTDPETGLLSPTIGNKFHLKPAAYQPPAEQPQIRASLYEARNSVIVMMKHTL